MGLQHCHDVVCVIPRCIALDWSNTCPPPLTTRRQRLIRAHTILSSRFLLCLLVLDRVAVNYIYLGTSASPSFGQCHLPSKSIRFLLCLLLISSLAAAKRRGFRPCGRSLWQCSASTVLSQIPSPPSASLPTQLGAVPSPTASASLGSRPQVPDEQHHLRLQRY